MSQIALSRHVVIAVFQVRAAQLQRLTRSPTRSTQLHRQTHQLARRIAGVAGSSSMFALYKVEKDLFRNTMVG